MHGDERTATQDPRSEFEFLDAGDMRMWFEPIQLHNRRDAVGRHADKVCSTHCSFSTIGGMNTDAEFRREFASQLFA